MHLHISDHSGLYRKIAARRAVRRMRLQFDKLIESADASPALRQEIQTIYTRHAAGIPEQVERYERRDSGADVSARRH